MKVFLLGAALAVGADTVSPETTRWFQATEQALMDAVAPGNSAAWERVMDPSCVVTTEEGEVLPRDRFLAQLRPLPAGLSGSIAVKALSVEEFQTFAIVRYLAQESESVFGQSLAVDYRVTNTYRRDGAGWKMVASHLSVVTRDPPAQPVSPADWPGLVGVYRLLPDGWTFTVELRDGRLVGGRDATKLRPLIPLAPHAFVLSGSLGEWHFLVENGRAARILNLRKFAPLVWTRVEAAEVASTLDEQLALRARSRRPYLSRRGARELSAAGLVGVWPDGAIGAPLGPRVLRMFDTSFAALAPQDGGG